MFMFAKKINTRQQILNENILNNSNVTTSFFLKTER